MTTYDKNTVEILRLSLDGQLQTINVKLAHAQTRMMGLRARRDDLMRQREELDNE